MKKSAHEDGYQLDEFVVGVDEAVLSKDEEESDNDLDSGVAVENTVTAKPLEVKGKTLDSKTSGINTYHRLDNQHLEDLIGEDTDLSVHEYDSEYFQDSDSDVDDYFEEKPVLQPKSKFNSPNKPIATPTNQKSSGRAKKDVVAEHFVTTKQKVESASFRELMAARTAPQVRQEHLDERPTKKARLGV